ncbi:MAG: carbamoyltransferase HypF [Deltaproteobacteria bacterium]|nr:carbamoyltransferase HypF [Deltaproteobacteria bacterium]
MKATLRRLKISIYGAVQGVGFRPFIYRLARRFDVSGFVMNTGAGVTIEVEGSEKTLEKLLLAIEPEQPPQSHIYSLEYSYLDPVGYQAFEVRTSVNSEDKSAVMLPDIAPCAECLEEVFDPKNRRYRYPFTNCTNCGPRFSIIKALPYDRANTSMGSFHMCEQCQHEYDDPENRRFHAQPNACPCCGPHIEFWDCTTRKISEEDKALRDICEAIRNGKIVAIKGIGGFHIVVDAGNEDAIKQLRERKHREEKPFAVLFPDLSTVQKQVDLDEIEKRSLVSSEAPIVLLRRKSFHDRIAPNVAPNNPYLGILLPFSPLHHLLMHELHFPVVATSGNLSNDPICKTEEQAKSALGSIVDYFLVHDRPIINRSDDSIVRVIERREMVLRRSRGYAPLPVQLDQALPDCVAVGGHLKNTFALAKNNRVFISQHNGDLETKESINAFSDNLNLFCSLYQNSPKSVLCDLHPDYYSTRFAKKMGVPVIQVQHHYAHALSCMAENSLNPPTLSVVWDGTGWGLDETIWGGEFLKITRAGFKRFAHMRPFPLLGGEKAIREPRRSAMGLLFEIFGSSVFSYTHLKLLHCFSGEELSIFQTMLERHLNSPYCSSVGRLFDAASALICQRERISFEGQAAMELEFLTSETQNDNRYDFSVREKDGAFVIDWEPIFKGLTDDSIRGAAPALMSVLFHNTLADIVVAIAQKASEEAVVLSGGCFQNKYLLEKTIVRLKKEGYRPYWHQRIPTNDGGIALGQMTAATMG